MSEPTLPPQPSDESDPFDALLRPEWASDTSVREPSAQEREREARELQRAFRRDSRRNRRINRIRDAKKSLKFWSIPLVFALVAGALGYAELTRDDGPSVIKVQPTVSEVRRIRVIEVTTRGRKHDPDFAATARADVEAMQQWFDDETNGFEMNIGDRKGSPIEVEHVAIDVTASSLVNQAFVSRAIESEMTRAGFVLDVDEAALVFTALQPTEKICGEATGRYAIVFPSACDQDAVEFSPKASMIAAHELLHVLGAVEECAPHHTSSRHVDDDPADLMFEPTRDRRRAPVQHLDPGRDDYYGHGRKDCIDLKPLPVWRRAN